MAWFLPVLMNFWQTHYTTAENPSLYFVRNLLMLCETAVVDGVTCFECQRCFECNFDRLPSFCYCRSLFRYEGVIREAILDLKQAVDLSFLQAVGALAWQAKALSGFSEPDCIIPVPLHPARYRARGFNQAALLAWYVFPQWRKRIHNHALMRVKDSVHKPYKRYQERVSDGMFEVSPCAELGNKRVLLVDDVVTTGQTIEACSKALIAAGAFYVEVFTLARSVACASVSSYPRAREMAA